MSETAVRLALRVGVGIATPAPPLLMASLRQATIEASRGSTPTGFELVFSVGSLSPLLDFFTAVGSRSLPEVRVAIGIVLRGLTTWLVDGVMTHQEVVTGDDGRSLLVKGRDLTAVMDREPHTDAHALSEAMRARVILLRYARYGIAPLVVEPGVSSVDGLIGAARSAVSSLGGMNATGAAGPGASQATATQEGTDYAYLAKLAEEVGWIFVVEPTTVGASIAYWGPEIRIGIPQRTLTADLDPFSRNVTSLRFSHDKEKRQSATIVIDKTQEVFDGIAWSHPLAVNVPDAASSVTVPQTEHLSPERARILGRAHAAAHADTLTGSGTLTVARYGDVLMPRRLVGVRGAGPANDGLHFVSKVTTTIRRGEITQSFELVREGMGSTVPLLETRSPWT